MASVIFAGQLIGAIVLPQMLFHQIQLMVSAWLARVYAEHCKPPPVTIDLIGNRRVAFFSGWARCFRSQIAHSTIYIPKLFAIRSDRRTLCRHMPKLPLHSLGCCSNRHEAN